MAVPDPEIAQAARTFLRHIAGRDLVKEVVLSGSRARFTRDDDSDADPAVPQAVRPASAVGSRARWRRSPSR
jgi:hypothetical protein